MNEKLCLATRLTHVGSDPHKQFGYVNPPVYRGSTVLYENVETMEALGRDPLRKMLPAYGRFGTPTCRALEEAMCEMEGGHGAICTNSGLSAITTALLAFVKAGDHILVSDSAYFPTRMFCAQSLSALGVETEFFDPRIGSKIALQFRPNTRLIFMESPGSLTFELHDTPTLCNLAREHGIVTLIDNTWATPVFFRPLDLGVDVSIHAATKYIAGHADSMLGIVVCNESTYPAVRTSAIRLGQSAGADDIYFALRGLRTLTTRLRQHERQALELCDWLMQQPQVEEVVHPALPNHPDHAIWRRDFRGASSLFGVILKSFDRKDVNRMVNSLKLFGIGHSWGGYESLIIPTHPEEFRQCPPWQSAGPMLRIYVGLEDLDDLKADLTQGLTMLPSPPE